MRRFETENLLLSCLSTEDLIHTAPPGALEEGHVAVGRGEAITEVCFRECGVTSVPMFSRMAQGLRWH